MKKIIFLILLFFVINISSFAETIEGSDINDNFTGDAFLRFTFPLVDKASIGENIFLSLATSIVSVGGGANLKIIPNVFTPGIYMDMGFALIDVIVMLINLSEKESEKQKESKKQSESSQPNLFNLGFRIFNQFRFGFIDIEPFAGLNFLFGTPRPIMHKMYGVILAYNEWGIEYTYMLPIFEPVSNMGKAWHRISIGIHCQ